MPYNFKTFGYEENEIMMLQDAEQAIDKADKWAWVKNTPTRLDYSFCADPEFQLICNNLRYLDHDSVTMAWTMKMMKKLATEGEEMHSQMMTPAAVEKEVMKRTPEMDAKVLLAYNNLEAFRSLPKWAKEYLRIYPQVLATKK